VKRVPVIDLFAGPGGLGEGFASASTHSGGGFDIALSVEAEQNASRTLRLRSFYRRIGETLPEAYLSLIAGDIGFSEFDGIIRTEGKEIREAWEAANEEAWEVTLGDRADDGLVNHRIHQLVAGEDTWVLIGGPPCQPFSVVGRVRNRAQAGYTIENDKRHDLYRHYLKTVATWWPKVFVMENVKGLLSSQVEGSSMFERICADLADPRRAVSTDSNGGPYRYRICSVTTGAEMMPGETSGANMNAGEYIVRCEDHGIPQKRHRLILVGIREDVQGRIGQLEHSATVTVGEALRGLPRLRSGLSRLQARNGYTPVTDSQHSWTAAIQNGVLVEGEQRRWVKTAGKIAGDEVRDLIVATTAGLEEPPDQRGGLFLSAKTGYGVGEPLRSWYAGNDLGCVLNHESRSHLDRDLLRYLYAACYAAIRKRSPRLPDFPADLAPRHDRRNAGKFIDRFRVQQESEPATTVTSHIGRDGHYYIHPDPSQCRSLTVREVARLQTFPDDYFFCGPRTSQYKQVGNAVPPFMAKQVAQLVMDLLENS
jgi:DNA (cytosine-5)-methyltransferase 1